MIMYIATVALLLLSTAHLDAQDLQWSQRYRDSTGWGSLGSTQLSLVKAVNGGFVAIGSTILDSTKVSGVHAYYMHIADDGTFIRDNVIDEMPGQEQRWIFPA